jgi:hypothetical protein
MRGFRLFSVFPTHFLLFNVTLAVLGFLLSYILLSAPCALLFTLCSMLFSVLSTALDTSTLGSLLFLIFALSSSLLLLAFYFSLSIAWALLFPLVIPCSLPSLVCVYSLAIALCRLQHVSNLALIDSCTGLSTA